MPISTTIAVTALLSIIAAAQHLYNLPDTSAKAARQFERQARYDAKRAQIRQELEDKEDAKNYSARDFGNRQHEATPEPEISSTITTQPGFNVDIVTPSPTPTPRMYYDAKAGPHGTIYIYVPMYATEEEARKDLGLDSIAQQPASEVSNASETENSSDDSEANDASAAD